MNDKNRVKEENARDGIFMAKRFNLPASGTLLQRSINESVT